MSSQTIDSNQQPPKKISSLSSFGAGIVKATGGTILGITMIGSAIVAGGLVGLAISFRNLPDVRVLNNYLPSETSYIYDIKGKLLTRLHGEANRELVPLSEISTELKTAVIAVEDSNFYEHNGINPYSIGRALIVNFRQGAVQEGASTLTMQLVKNLFLTQERTFSRKLAEAILAIRVEQVFSKEEILEMYLNNIYWGHNNYGVQTAAETYFNKNASELNLEESAMMAGLIQAPEQYSPFTQYSATKRRQAIVLERMATLGWISTTEKDEAKKAPLLVNKPTAWSASKLPFITEAVVSELKERFGEDKVLLGGMRVQTTIDVNFQKMAEKSLQEGFNRLRRWGVRADQAALIAIDPRTHFVKALVGGVNYDESQFNRVLQARRQPGSAFKPFVYYTAFASGKYSPYSTIQDTKVSYRVPSGWYTPQNYGKSFSGTIALRTALIKSKNVPAVKLGKAVGLEEIIEVSRRLGLKSPLQPVISLPLGSIGVTPMEMAGAYATFASNGWYNEPTLILQVADSRGNVLLENRPQPQLILDPWATASLTSVLKGVIAPGGTAPNADIGRPAAGKTGTTSSERDVWFVGYVPQLATAVWVGNDNYKSLGRGVTGGGHAAPIWRSFMSKALANEPVKYFPAASQFTRPKENKK
ncbi:MAG: transglycosylase domain-containing protein [Xenococcus sp. (in: cyanobacteria)]